MTTIDDEYVSALELVRSASSGQEILQSLSSVAGSLTKKVFEASLGTRAESAFSKIISRLNRPDARLILDLLGREEVEQIVHKNCVFVFARILTLVRAFDSHPPLERLAPLIDLFAAIAPQAKEWACHHEAASHPIHDKKERLKRRQALLHEEQTRTQAASQLLLESIRASLIPILLPKGAASLYLPKGGSLLHSHIDKALNEPLCTNSSLEHEEKLLRDLKVTIMYWLLSALCQRLGSEKFDPPNYNLPNDLTTSIESLLEPLRSAFLPMELSKETPASPNAIASSIARTLLFLVESTSLESILVSGWLSISGSFESFLHTEAELETLTETMSHDDRLIRAILHLATPTIDLGPSGAKDLTGSFWSMLLQGLTSSMTDIVIEDALSSVDWESAQRMVLDRIRWFFFSPYGDRAVATWVKSMNHS